MSRISTDPNNWIGDLNDNGLSAAQITAAKAKTDNTTVQKRYGPLGVAGVAGHVKNHGGQHEVVFELTGDEILFDNGVQLARALETKIPVNARITEADVIVHEAFGAGSVIIVDLEGQLLPDGVLVNQNVIPGWNLDAVGELEGTTNFGPVVPPADFVLGTIMPKTFELGGTLFVNFNNCVAEPLSKSGGRAEIVVRYTAL